MEPSPLSSHCPADIRIIVVCAFSCFSSPLTRAATTAEIIWEGRDEPLIFLEELKEANLGYLQGMKNGNYLCLHCSVWYRTNWMQQDAGEFMLFVRVILNFYGWCWLRNDVLYQMLPQRNVVKNSGERLLSKTTMFDNHRNIFTHKNQGTELALKHGSGSKGCDSMTIDSLFSLMVISCQCFFLAPTWSTNSGNSVSALFMCGFLYKNLPLR